MENNTKIKVIFVGLQHGSTLNCFLVEGIKNERHLVYHMCE